MSRALALIYSNYPMMFLGHETDFRSPGISPDTLAPWVGQGKVRILLYVLLQVSNIFYIIEMCSTDIVDLSRAHVGTFSVIFDPLLEGAKHKNYDFS